MGTFAATDHKVAVHASKTAADYVPPLSLSRILAGQTPREYVPQVDLLIPMLIRTNYRARGDTYIGRVIDERIL